MYVFSHKHYQDHNFYPIYQIYNIQSVEKIRWSEKSVGKFQKGRWLCIQK